eukprot:102969-Hanusia_phi.AAC.1
MLSPVLVFVYLFSLLTMLISIKNAIFLLNGRRISLSPTQILVGDESFPRSKVRTQQGISGQGGGGGGGGGEGTHEKFRQLASWQLFRSIHDGNIDGVEKLLRHGMADPNAVLVLRNFPNMFASSPSAESWGEEEEEERESAWPAVGFEGRDGESALHL